MPSVVSIDKHRQKKSPKRWEFLATQKLIITPTGPHEGITADFYIGGYNFADSIVSTQDFFFTQIPHTLFSNLVQRGAIYNNITRDEFFKRLNKELAEKDGISTVEDLINENPFSEPFTYIGLADIHVRGVHETLTFEGAQVTSGSGKLLGMGFITVLNPRRIGYLEELEETGIHGYVNL